MDKLEFSVKCYFSTHILSTKELYKYALYYINNYYNAY